MKREMEKIKIYKVGNNNYGIVVYENGNTEFVTDSKLSQKIKELYFAKDESRSAESAHELLGYLKDNNFLTIENKDIIETIESFEEINNVRKYTVKRASGKKEVLEEDSLNTELMDTYGNTSLIDAYDYEEEVDDYDEDNSPEHTNENFVNLKVSKKLIKIIAAGISLILISTGSYHIGSHNRNNKSNNDDSNNNEYNIESKAPDQSSLGLTIFDSNDQVYTGNSNESFYFNEPIVEEVRNGIVTQYYEGDHYNFDSQHLLDLSSESFNSVRNYFLDPKEYPMEKGKASYIDFSYGFSGDDKIYLQNFSEIRNNLEERRFNIAENQNDENKRKQAIEDFKILLRDSNIDNIIRIVNNEAGVYTNDNGYERYIYFDDLSIEAKDLIMGIAEDMRFSLLNDKVNYDYNGKKETYTSDDIYHMLDEKYNQYHSKYSR